MFADEEIRETQEEEQRNPGQKSKPPKNRQKATGRNAKSVALRYRTGIYAGFAEGRYFGRVAEVRRAGEAFPRDPRAISEVSRLNSARFSLATLGGRESKCSCKIRVARSAAKSNLDFLLLMG
jgi:hypothetical protein